MFKRRCAGSQYTERLDRPEFGRTVSLLSMPTARCQQRSCAPSSCHSGACDGHCRQQGAPSPHQSAGSLPTRLQPADPAGHGGAWGPGSGAPGALTALTILPSPWPWFSPPVTGPPFPGAQLGRVLGMGLCSEVLSPPKIPVSVSWSCCHQLPQTGWLKTMQKPKVHQRAGPCSVCRLQGRVLPAPSRHPSACDCVIQSSCGLSSSKDSCPKV